MRAIFGLGNPGRNYEKTRHNVGFMILDALSNQLNIPIHTNKFKGLIGEGFVNGEKIILVKPQTYMNLSGECVREVIDWYKIAVDNICIIYDDLDLPVGSIRLRFKGSAGGHNGMKSIIQHVGTEQIKRIKVGINRPPVGWKVPDYVLAPFKDDEWIAVNTSITKAVGAIQAWSEESFEKVMTHFNGS